MDKISCSGDVTCLPRHATPGRLTRLPKRFDETDRCVSVRGDRRANPLRFFAPFEIERERREAAASVAGFRTRHRGARWAPAILPRTDTRLLLDRRGGLWGPTSVVVIPSFVAKQSLPASAQPSSRWVRLPPGKCHSKIKISCRMQAKLKFLHFTPYQLSI